MHETREAWLIAAADEMRKFVFANDEHEFEVPEFQVSVGWPKGKRTEKVIGQCFNTSWTDAGLPSVFISPILKAEIEILACLAHEMIHVRDNCESGHQGHFAYVFKRIGMAGKRTECGISEDLKVKMHGIVDRLGAYPHAKMRSGATAGKGKGPKKQTTRMLKVLCADEACGYTIRTTRQWIDKGLPTCVCGAEFVEV